MNAMMAKYCHGEEGKLVFDRNTPALQVKLFSFPGKVSSGKALVALMSIPTNACTFMAYSTGFRVQDAGQSSFNVRNAGRTGLPCASTCGL